MNRFAYLTTDFAIKTLSGLSKAKIRLHGKENVPDAPTIFVINHFTRLETIFMPYHIHQITHVPVWSLADYTLFEGMMGTYLNKFWAVSTKNPDRDRLIVKSLLTGEASWIIFPEGCMVKDKKIIENGQLMTSCAGGKHPPHTGAATLALRTEFYRQRLSRMSEEYPDEAKRLMGLFQISSIEPVIEKTTYIVPINITYYPMRAKENIISRLAEKFVGDIPDRMEDEIMTEGTMLLSGVDVDIRFGKPIGIKDLMENVVVEQDIAKKEKIDFDDPIPSKQIMRNIASDIMHRYMSAIYGMTTVNHDHLFASILRLIPFEKINTDDLKRRVFLAATCDLKEKGVYFHTSLGADQIHLFVDDRYDKFKEFIGLAIEKGIVTKKGNMLIKDMSKFSSPFDFHHVRIDNPVSVMANEVEPLTSLQKKLTDLASQSSSRLKSTIRKKLLGKAISEFEEDYEQFHVREESKGKEVGMPFLMKGNSEELGVLLIHGYMSAPLQVKELASHIAGMGIWVYAVRLKGHGTSPDDLAIRTYADWAESVEAGYALIRNICDNVIVGGFSTGAALALDLAARVREAKGVFAICPPLRLRDVAAKFAPAMEAWNRLMKMARIGRVPKEFIRNKSETPHIDYFRNPISGIRAIEELMDNLESELPDIRIPALVAQSYDDPVVNPKGSSRIFELLGSEDKQYVLFNFDRHCIISGEGAHRVHRVIGDFIRYLGGIGNPPLAKGDFRKNL